VIHGSPQVDHLAIQLHIHFVEVPPPVTKATHPAHPSTADVAGEQRTEPVPPQPHRFVANVDPAFEQQILNVPQRQREADVHEHH
jgi:hypothetical protein